MFLNRRSLLFFFAILILASNIGLISWFTFSGFRSYFDSDAATKVLLADEIVRTSKYFPPDWVYANGDLWVFFGHTFIIPLLKIFPISFLVHAISSYVFVILIFISVFLVLNLFNLSWLKKYSFSL